MNSHSKEKTSLKTMCEEAFFLRTIKYLFSSMIVFILSTPVLIYANNDSGGVGGGIDNGGGVGGGANPPVVIPNPLGNITLIGLFKIILDVVMIFTVPLIVFFIIYSGFLYVTAQGNQETISKAHKALLYALIGGLLILGANVLIDVIQGTVDSITQ